MFRLIKRCLFTDLEFLTGVNSLNCVSMSNQKCEKRQQIVNVNKQVNIVILATISIIHAQNCVFLIWKTRLVEITSSKNENKHKCSSCTLHIVLFSIIFTINVGIGSYFLYFFIFIYSC